MQGKFKCHPDVHTKCTISVSCSVPALVNCEYIDLITVYCTIINRDFVYNRDNK